MEIGSYIELQFPTDLEYYSNGKFPGLEIARLNSGRAAIWHAFRVSGCQVIYLPYYQCESVRAFLLAKQVCVKYYHMDAHYQPIDLAVQKNECVLLVNYFGIMSHERLEGLAAKYQNVIIDHAQAFFAQPIETCLNVYSARKFIGVPDGAYVVGKNASCYVDEYAQGYSSDTSLFLLQRIEYGCQGKAYQSRSSNEERLEKEDICRMSRLTHAILDGADTSTQIAVRRKNFQDACELFDGINQLDNSMWYQDDCVPMVYPLLIEDDSLLSRLLEHHHFQGHWWHYLVEEMSPDSFEYYLSRYMIPITIDQRYSKKELQYLRSVVDGEK